jgi:hypothetical protein
MFQPKKVFHYWCSWTCRQADPRDPRGHQRARAMASDRGSRDGLRTTIPPAIWKALVQLCHPDRWEGSAGLQALAHEASVWLLEHRPLRRTA